MSLRPIYGHEALLHRLAGAIATSRFPQATLFTGPPGVGKQRLALWAAQTLLCEQGGEGTPCGECDGCRRVLNLTHPDLHWFVPIQRPKAGDADKQVEEARETLGAAMAERRQNPLWQRPDRMASHSLASVRLLHRMAWVTPFAGQRKVFVLGDAERLVVQEASQEAANALLKVLEEPPQDTTLILTAADPEALLPTIRSRLVTLRVSRVADGDVRRFLSAELDPPLAGRALERRTVLAEGSIGRALWADDEGEGADRRAAELVEAISSGAEGWAAQALGQAPWAARGDFTGLLDALAVRLRAGLADEAGQDESLMRARLEALRRVEETRASAQGNVNPQLALAVLASDLEHLL
jgi:DNA polymerase-3 subunit delta'